MRAQVVFLSLLLFSWSSIAQPPPPGFDSELNQPPKLTEDNISQQTEILRNPGLAVDNALKALSPESMPGQNQPPPIPVPATLNESGHISDPTQMTGSFSQALNRINAKPGQNGATIAAPTLPEISLSAKAICHHANKAALLNVGGKKRMVKEGGKFSFVANNIFYEIKVTKIENDHVDIIVMPMGRQMTLE